MSFSMRTIAVFGAGFLFSTTSVFAQAGGAELPSDAKAVGTMENGPTSTGMSKREAKQRSGMMRRNSTKTMMKHGTMPKRHM